MRESHLSEQLNRHEVEVESEFRRHTEVREEKTRELRTLLESHISLRDQTTDRFQLVFNSEISKLHNRLQSEIEVHQSIRML